MAGIQVILKQIDAEIDALLRARALLLGEPVKGRRGRPRGSGAAKVKEPAKRKRSLSAEGRARIAAAQKKRWAAKKKGE
jgi:hypothetical protein